jgi:hypothetical protein
VDAVGWLERRGALTLTDGSAAVWATSPTTGEALYDVARDVLFALYRPSRMVQSITTVAALLDQRQAGSGNEERRMTAQAARRLVVERPVVYFRDVADGVENHLRGAALAEDLRRITGLRVERRAEGVLLIDTARFSPDRFPGTSAPAQAAILLAVDLADRIIDPDGRRVRRLEWLTEAAAVEELTAAIDAGVPTATIATFSTGPGSPATGSELGFGVPDPDPDPDPDGAVPADANPDGVHRGSADRDPEIDADGDQPAARVGLGTRPDGRAPFIADSFLRTSVADILVRYEGAFGIEWHAAPDRLLAEALDVLTRFGLVRPVPGGVLVLPLAGRYRITTATTTRARRAQPELF